MNRRRVNKAFGLLSKTAAVICSSILLFLFAIIFVKGSAAINLDFIFTASENFGADGGILYQLIGSVILIITTAIIVFPLGLGLAIFKSEYIKSSKLQKITTTLLYILNGIPSVIFGIFGLIFFVNQLNTGISWLVGSIILAIMILPTVCITSYHSLNAVPSIYRESGLALGYNKEQVIKKILIPKSIKGAITGLLLGLARAIGETAPVMFIATAFSGVEIPSSIYDPVATLPTHILALSQQATNPDALNNAWGASLILIILTISFSFTALFIRIRHKNSNI